MITRVFVRRNHRPFRAAALALALLTVVGCSDRAPSEPTVDGVEVKEVILMASDGSVAYSHRDHWHGAPVVRAGESVSIDLHFTALQTDADVHEAPAVESWFRLGDKASDFNLRVVIEDTTVARWSGDSNRGTLTGLRAGASRMSLVVRRGSTTIFEAPPLNFRVQAPR